MMRLRISGCTFICTIFTARNVPVGTCTAFCTTPPAPLPHAPTTASSSKLTSKSKRSPPLASRLSNGALVSSRDAFAFAVARGT